jgi:hypothetical protein
LISERSIAMKDHHRGAQLRDARITTSNHNAALFCAPLLLIGCSFHDVGYLQQGGNAGSSSASAGSSQGGDAGTQNSSSGVGGSGGTPAVAGGTTGGSGNPASCDGNTALCASPDMIADFESNDGHLCGSEGGTVVAFGDGTGTTSPMMGDLTAFDPSDDCDRGSAYALHALVSGAKDYGFGLTFRLPKIVDATADGYKGVRFKAQASASRKISIKVATPSTLEAQFGGSCEPTTTPKKDCNDHFASSVVVATGGWLDYQVEFASLKQEGWGVPGTPNYAAILQIVVVFPGPISGGSADFDVWLDDISFYK